MMTRWITPLCLAAVALTLFVGCGSEPTWDTQYLTPFGVVTQGRPTGPGGPAYDTVSYWDGNGVPGSPSIVIRLGEQRAYFYKGGQLVGVSTVSTGREGYDTPPGQYKVMQKEIDHVSSLYGDYVDKNGNVVVANVDTKKDKRPPGTIYRGAPMPYFMRIKGGYGMHAGYLPGFPASHGCIRMPEFMAENFFANVSVGTPVTIQH